ncbi:type II toxin-antitoxin system VapC family toxin [Demequina sp.]|uniref:type II toxin-antitoxin system VapC family toxin n=1 Tax=Demequina sp. TaxID=2050685 RepID=UPI003D0E699C
MTRYFDSSALTKLVADEAESATLRAHLAASPDAAMTSIVAVPEVGIATSRADATVGQRVTGTLGWLRLPGLNVATAPLNPARAQSAARLGTQLKLRALDAIHVATAHAARDTITEVVTYDKAMVAACLELGLPVVSPGA